MFKIVGAFILIGTIFSFLSMNSEVAYNECMQKQSSDVCSTVKQ